MAKVRLFDGDEVVGLVPYVENLDHWDGHNWTSGSTGHHLGIGRLKDGGYYVCYGTQWEGERDYAEKISKKEAQNLCLKHDPEIWDELFDEPIPEL